jgi:hypothetical protein
VTTRKFAAEVWHRALGYAIPTFSGIAALWLYRAVVEASYHIS